MYRLMQPSDEAAVLALWQSQHHDTEDFAKMVLERFAGVQNIYVADENDAIVAAALAVPVTLQGRTGNSRQTQHRPLCCRIKALQRLLPCAACPVR